MTSIAPEARRMSAARLFVSSFLTPLVFAAGAAVAAYVLGGLLAWLLGAVAVWNVGVFALRIALHRMVAKVILANHPERLELSPASEPATESFVELELELLSLGFANATPLVVAPMTPPATLRGFVLPGRPVYATVFLANRTELNFDFVSVVEGLRGGLTTIANPRAATLPGCSGTLRQIFPGLGPAALLAKHLESLDALERRGLRFMTATAEGLLPALRASLARTRAEYLKNRFTWTQVALRRVSRNDYPETGSVLERADAAPEIERLVKAA